MKKILLSAWILILSLSALGQNHNVFHTSVCYDMLSSFDSYEKLISNPFFAITLAKDSAFIADVQAINMKVRPSNLCNLYASLPTDKNDVNACYRFLESLKQDDIPEKFRGKYVENIFSVIPQIRNAIRQMIRADYPKYWEEQVYPVMKQRIDGFTFEDGILDKIHKELTCMAGGDALSEEYSKTYISHKLGLKTDEDVYREFQDYVDGSLVLAPIVYTRISQKTESQSLDRFLLNLFETEFIKSGKVEKQYREVMEKLKRRYSSDM